MKEKACTLLTVIDFAVISRVASWTGTNIRKVLLSRATILTGVIDETTFRDARHFSDFVHSAWAVVDAVTSLRFEIAAERGRAAE